MSHRRSVADSKREREKKKAKQHDDTAHARVIIK